MDSMENFLFFLSSVRKEKDELLNSISQYLYPILFILKAILIKTNLFIFDKYFNEVSSLSPTSMITCQNTRDYPLKNIFFEKLSNT